MILGQLRHWNPDCGSHGWGLGKVSYLNKCSTVQVSPEQTPSTMAKRKKRKLGQNEGQGKGVFLALGVGGAVLVGGVALAMLVFKKNPKLPSQQAQVADENKSSESEDNGFLVPENTPGALTNSAGNPKISSSINLDLPAGKKIVWSIGKGKFDIRKIYTGKSISMLTKAFGKEASLKTGGEVDVYSYDQMKVLAGGKRYSKVFFFVKLGSNKEDEDIIVQVSLDPKSVIANPLDADLVAYYPFNGNAKDESGKGRHGAFKSGHRGYVAGRFGSGIAMSASTSIALPLGHFQECSVSMWVKPMAIGKINHLLSAHGSSLGYVTIQLGILEQGYPQVGVNEAPYIWNYSDLMRTVRFPRNLWNHIAFCWGSSGLQLYLNGQLIAVGKTHKGTGKLPIYPRHLPGSPAVPVRLNKNTKEWRLGAMAKKKENPSLVCVIDEVRIFNRALSALDIKTLYEY